jgi:hypothetical protein
MKIYYIKAIAVLALSLAFTACSKDEETVLGTGTVALELITLLRRRFNS